MCDESGLREGVNIPIKLFQDIIESESLYESLELSKVQGWPIRSLRELLSLGGIEVSAHLKINVPPGFKILQHSLNINFNLLSH